MISSRKTVPALVGLVLSAICAGAQPLQYRISGADEGTYFRLNSQTPFNYANSVVPQPGWGNVATAGLYLGEGVLSTSLGFRASSSSIAAPSYDFSVRELALDISLGEAFDLVAGKKILKWGTGYAFNPTGVVEPQRSPSDPSDRVNQNGGRNLVSLTAFVG